MYVQYNILMPSVRFSGISSCGGGKFVSFHSLTDLLISFKKTYYLLRSCSCIILREAEIKIYSTEYYLNWLLSYMFHSFSTRC